MKLKLFIILGTFINCLSISSQSYKIIYDFKWRAEEKSSNYSSELTILLKTEENSYFESLAKFKYDSIKTQLVDEGSRSFPSPKTAMEITAFDL